MPEKRTSADLIEELRSEAERPGRRVGLVVRFEERTEVVWSEEDAAVIKLTSLIQNGGEPIGLVALEGGGVVVWRTLEEYDDEEWVEKDLITFVAEITRSLAASGHLHPKEGPNGKKA